METSANTIINKLNNNETLSKEELTGLCQQATQLMTNDSNVASLTGACTVVSDIRSDLARLKKILATQGSPADGNNLLFLGNFANMHGNTDTAVSTFAYLLALKVLSPANVVLLRGHSDSRTIAKMYKLHEKITGDYDEATFEAMYQAVDTFQVAAILNNHTFCVPGGIAKGVSSIEEINALDRKKELEKTGALTDMIWSDPNEVGKEDFDPSPRSVAFLYPQKAVSEFLSANGLSFMIRGHQFHMDGFNYNFGEDGQVLSIFALANYGDKGNKGAYVTVAADGQRTVTSYEHSE